LVRNTDKGLVISQYHGSAVTPEKKQTQTISLRHTFDYPYRLDRRHCIASDITGQEEIENGAPDGGPRVMSRQLGRH